MYVFFKLYSIKTRPFLLGEEISWSCVKVHVIDFLACPHYCVFSHPELEAFCRKRISGVTVSVISFLSYTCNPTCVILLSLLSSQYRGHSWACKPIVYEKLKTSFFLVLEWSQGQNSVWKGIKTILMKSVLLLLLLFVCVLIVKYSSELNPWVFIRQEVLEFVLIVFILLYDPFHFPLYTNWSPFECYCSI